MGLWERGTPLPLPASYLPQLGTKWNNSASRTPGSSLFFGDGDCAGEWLWWASSKAHAGREHQRLCYFSSTLYPASPPGCSGWGFCPASSPRARFQKDFSYPSHRQPLLQSPAGQAPAVAALPLPGCSSHPPWHAWGHPLQLCPLCPGCPTLPPTTRYDYFQLRPPECRSWLLATAWSSQPWLHWPCGE